MSSVIISGDTSGAITLAAPAVAGTNTINLPAAAGTVMVSGNMPAFSVYGSAFVSASSNTFTKITYTTADFDTASAFSFANSRFTPLVAGYYQISASIYQSGGGVGGFFTSLFKNGSRYADGASMTTQVGQDSGSQLTMVVYLNGSTDYIEIWGYQGTAGTLSIGSNNYLRKFTGVLVRAA